MPGIPPDERTAVVIMFAICLGLNLILNSAGIEIRRGKIAELETPKLKELNITVKYVQPIPSRKIEIIPQRKRESARNLIFFEEL